MRKVSPTGVVRADNFQIIIRMPVVEFVSNLCASPDAEHPQPLARVGDQPESRAVHISGEGYVKLCK